MAELTVTSTTGRAVMRIGHRYANGGRGALITVGAPRDGGAIEGVSIALTPEQCREVAAQLIERAEAGEP